MNYTERVTKAMRSEGGTATAATIGLRLSLSSTAATRVLNGMLAAGTARKTGEKRGNSAVWELV